jgi:hypothetical protein
MAEGAAADKSFPVRTRQWSAAVEGVDTDFLASGYADWIMLVATQTGTLGTMMQARWAAWRSASSGKTKNVTLAYAF